MISLYAAILCLLIVNCQWSEWESFPYTFPGPRSDGSKLTTCKDLQCDEDKMSPKVGKGQRHREKVVNADYGGKCDEDYTETCTESCPGINLLGTALAFYPVTHISKDEKTIFIPLFSGLSTDWLDGVVMVNS